MQTSATLNFPASADRVAAMLAHPDYQRERLTRLGLDDAASASVTVSPNQPGDAAFSVSLTASVSAQSVAAKLPPAASRFIRGGMTVTVTETWGAKSGDSTRQGKLTVDTGNLPVSGGATLHLEPQGETSCRMRVDADITVSVPLIGRSIEQRAIAQVGRVIADEESRAAAWLAVH